MSQDQAARDAALAAWAEEVQIDPDDPKLLRGQDAQAYGRDLLARVGRRPLDPDQPKGQKAPRRQVRLPAGLSDAVDQLAGEQNKKPSEVMRTAIAEYISRHKASA